MNRQGEGVPRERSSEKGGSNMNINWISREGWKHFYWLLATWTFLKCSNHVFGLPNASTNWRPVRYSFTCTNTRRLGDGKYHKEHFALVAMNHEKKNHNWVVHCWCLSRVFNSICAKELRDSENTKTFRQIRLAQGRKRFFFFCCICTYTSADDPISPPWCTTPVY